MNALNFFRHAALTALTISLSAASLAKDTHSPMDKFLELVSLAGMTYTAPENFTPQQAPFNEMFQYEHVAMHSEGEMEIRYAIRPLSQIEIDYEDPHSATPEPNHIYPLMFSAITDRLSGAKHSPSNEYSDEEAKKLFNADWAAASVFDVQKEFSEDFKQGTLLALHGNRKADAYIIFLFNDYAVVKNDIKSALQSLQFETSTEDETTDTTLN